MKEAPNLCIYRGGSWFNKLPRVRVAFRMDDAEVSFASISLGFRTVQTGCRQTVLKKGETP